MVDIDVAVHEQPGGGAKTALVSFRFPLILSILMSPSGNGRKSLAFRRSLEVKRPCADISDDESHEIRSEVPLGMDYQIPPGGAEWGGGDAGARTGARDL